MSELYEKQRVETENIKCDGCGSNMAFDPQSQMLYCAHCGRKVEFATQETATEQNIELAFGDNDGVDEETVVFRCENCGAKVVLDKSETAKKCPYCSTAHVVEDRENKGIKPNGVLPFTFTKDKAGEYLKSWGKKKWLAPKKFKKELQGDKMSGVYTPCFTFDSQTVSQYVGRIGERRTRTVGSGKNRRTETYIVYRNISGTLEELFDDIQVSAGEKISQKELNKLCPYATNDAKAYEKNYLLGFMAYHYDKDAQTCWGEAKGMIDAEIRRLILSRYSYSVVDYLNVSTTHSNVSFKYVLLPVYVGHYTFKKKDFRYFVNGTTGKVWGKSPLSFWKMLLLVLGIALFLVLLVFIFSNYYL